MACAAGVIAALASVGLFDGAFISLVYVMYGVDRLVLKLRKDK